MLSLVVLFTVFLGLIGVLVLLNELQRKWSRSHDPQLLQQQLDEWIRRNNVHLPTAEETLHMLNSCLSAWIHKPENKSEDYSDLCINELLPGTAPPQFSMTKVIAANERSIVFNCDIEWPMCVPGVAVSVVPLGEDTPVTCHLQIEWMYAHARLTLSHRGGVLLISFSHTHPPIMGISCGVLDQQLDDEGSTKLASSVADGLQGMFNELSLEGVAMIGMVRRTQSVPVVLVSGPEDAECTSEQTTDQEHVETRPVEGECDTHNEPVMEEGVDGNKAMELVESDAEEQSDPVVVSNVAGDDVDMQLHESELIEADQPLVEAKVQETEIIDDQEPEALNDDSGDPGPSSPGWRRSSSYEQLANSLLDTPTFHTPSVLSGSMEVIPRGNVTTPQRKALTLSMAGSEAESIYGADERIPSTLVFEVKDSIRTKHIVALSTAHANKLRRHFSHAQKLHIYNDHCFVATHLKERMLCAVCKSKITGIFGKQTYLCRDCGLTVHKQCHFKTESLCSNSQLPQMNLVYPSTVSTVSS